MTWRKDSWWMRLPERDLPYSGRPQQCQRQRLSLVSESKIQRPFSPLALYGGIHSYVPSSGDLFFFCSSNYYMVLNCSLWQTIYNKQPIVFEASEDRNSLYRQIKTLLQSEEIRNKIQIKVAHNQPTNNASKSRETYHTENTESEETEKRKLRVYLQNQKSKTLEHSQRLRERRRLFLRRKCKCTQILLQEINKVLNQQRQVN